MILTPATWLQLLAFIFVSCSDWHLMVQRGALKALPYPANVFSHTYFTNAVYLSSILFITASPWSLHCADWSSGNLSRSHIPALTHRRLNKLPSRPTMHNFTMTDGNSFETRHRACIGTYIHCLGSMAHGDGPGEIGPRSALRAKAQVLRFHLH